MRAARALVSHALLALAVTAHAGEFVDLGAPVRSANVMNAMVGPDAEGRMTRIYANMMAAGALSFLLQIDPATGDVERFELPEGKSAWNSIVGPDGRVYLGVAGGGPGVALWAFDPARPEAGIEPVADLSDTETSSGASRPTITRSTVAPTRTRSSWSTRSTLARSSSTGPSPRPGPTPGRSSRAPMAGSTPLSGRPSGT